MFLGPICLCPVMTLNKTAQYTAEARMCIGPRNPNPTRKLENPTFSPANLSFLRTGHRLTCVKHVCLPGNSSLAEVADLLVNSPASACSCVSEAALLQLLDWTATDAQAFFPPKTLLATSLCEMRKQISLAHAFLVITIRSF